MGFVTQSRPGRERFGYRRKRGRIYTLALLGSTLTAITFPVHDARFLPFGPLRAVSRAYRNRARLRCDRRRLLADLPSPALGRDLARRPPAGAAASLHRR